MTKFGAPLVARSGAAGQLGAVLFLAFGLFVACGNDIPEVPSEGDAGASNRAGSSSGKAGKGGSGAEAGEEQLAGAAGNGEAGVVEPGSTAGTGGTGGTSGANSTGGTSGKGGSGGAGGASGASGKGGTGGTGPLCGNNVLDAGEACDDGNTKFGDSCSPTCTNICETCEKNVCGTSGDFNTCDNGWSEDAAATAGPAVGTKKSVLCNALVACLKRTGCAQYDQSSVLKKCYCGTASAVECQEPGKPNGACSEEIAAAGEDRKFNLLTQRQNTVIYALGVASQVYGLCDGGICANECVQGKSSTECEKCSAKVNADDFAACYVNPKGDPGLSAELCTAAVECAHRTGCALNGVPSCYAVNTGSGSTAAGPCATELTAAGKGKTPLEISSELASPSSHGPLAAAALVLRQELENCKATCFASSSGGQGGSGGAGTAGGTSGTGG